MGDDTVFSHTPTVAVCGPDGRSLRTVGYERTSTNLPAVARVTRSWFNADKRIARQYDPRLFALSQTEAQPPANLQTLSSLSGAVLLNESVDSGWNLTLNTESGQASDSWDSRGSHAWMEYDALLRPLAQHEQAKDGSARVSSRFSYAPGNAGEAAINRCGRPARLDDDAGTELYLDYSMAGAAIRTSRHWTRHNTLPDWPLEIPARDALLRETPAAVTSIRHNALAEPISQNDAQQNRQTFAHTRGGQLHSIRLTPAEAQPVQIASDLRYNAHGQIVQQRLGNGVLSTLVYDPTNGQLRQHRTAHPDASLLQDLHYQRDPLGNIVAIEDAAQPIRFFRNQTISARRTFAYDSLYRLIQATGFEAAENLAGPELPGFQSPPDPTQLANYSRHYRYDGAGNLTTVRHVGARNFTRHQVNTRTSNRGLNHDADAPPPCEATINAAFDGNGNLKALQPGQALTWSVKNQLLEVSQVTRDTANDTELYRYDHSGRRQRKLRSWRTARVEHVEEVHYLPDLERRYNSARSEELHISIVSTPLGEVRLLHWPAGRPSELSSDQYRYGIADHQRSCGLELDAQARLISQEAYYPYGGTAWWAGHDQVQANYKVIRYSGQERDATGLYYYGMRYYAPWLQRWINPDPAGVADGLNLYAMVHGNPVGNVDNQGLATNDETWRAVWQGVARDLLANSLSAMASLGVGAFLGTLAQDEATNIGTTIVAGVAIGGGVAALFAPLGQSFMEAVRDQPGTWGGRAAGALGFLLGAAPAAAGYFNRQLDDEGTPSPVNDTANNMIRTMFSYLTYQMSQAATTEMGARFAWRGLPEWRPALTTTGLSAGARALNGYLSMPLEDGVRLLGAGGLIEVLESVTTTLLRSRSPNAEYRLNEPEGSISRAVVNSIPSRFAVIAIVENLRQFANAWLSPVPRAVINTMFGTVINLRITAHSWLETLQPGNWNLNPAATTTNRRIAYQPIPGKHSRTSQ
ncbi:RHS repeat-associated core domain-containing protein [Pseudomonas putida]|uniref:RHS repeat-associated core domain-containing protein n=1 Tax=Pseudomonas putida TaxID=303 RepID=UPI002365E664|nr:RHS repeat-associated core domain-containing protein [Pseudomonas putida]MDD2048223.1 RHS repeat-associated core domain-containing protein [Pseudomonas putida]